MSAKRLLRPSFLLLASLLLAPNFANAEPSLAEAIKKLDAKYLSVPDLAAKDAAPKIEAGGGADDAKPAAQEISQGGVPPLARWRKTMPRRSNSSCTAPGSAAGSSAS